MKYIDKVGLSFNAEHPRRLASPFMEPGDFAAPNYESTGAERQARRPIAHRVSGEARKGGDNAEFFERETVSPRFSPHLRASALKYTASTLLILLTAGFAFAAETAEQRGRRVVDEAIAA